MLSAEQLKSYRQMPPEERFRLSLQLSAYAWEAIAAEPPEIARRKWALIRRQHQAASDALVAKFKELP